MRGFYQPKKLMQNHIALILRISMAVMVLANGVVTPIAAAAELEAQRASTQTLARTTTKRSYTPLTFVEGDRSDIDLYLRNVDAHLDFLEQKKSEIKLRMNASSLVDQGTFPQSIKIVAYTLNGSEKDMLNTLRATVYNRKQSKHLNMLMDLGHFATTSKTIYFDLYNTVNEIIGTYRYTFTAANLDFQADDDTKASLPASTCDDDGVLDDCDLQYFLSKVNFEALPSKSVATQARREADGTYTVTIPLTRGGANVSGKRTRVKKTGGGGSTSLSSFEMSETQLALGVDADNLVRWTYDPDLNSLTMSFNGEAGNIKAITVTDNGKVGIGVDSPQAWVHIQAGTQGTPAST
jgi:hypothetical protein